MKLIYEIKDIKDNFTSDEIEDVKKINKALFNYYGITGDFRDVYNLWEAISDAHCAGWLIVPDDDKEIIDMIKYNI